MRNKVRSRRGADLEVKNRIDYVDTPEIKPEIIIDILKGFKEKSPGPSGITRNFLLNTHKNPKLKFLKQIKQFLNTKRSDENGEQFAH